MPQFPRPRPNRPSATVAALLAALLIGPAACSERAREPESPAPETLISAGPHEVAVLAIRDLGEIRIELLPEVAPQTAESFKRLVLMDFYVGTNFHRVIPGFMIQGGDPLSKDLDPRNDGQGGLENPIPDEFSTLPHLRGTVAMANKGRNSARAQFFVVQEDSPHLDGHYTIFGRVVAGMDVVDAITELEIDKFGRWGPRNRPYPVQAVVEASRIEAAGPKSSETASIAAAEGV